MRLVVTRPQSDGGRTAGALRARGHDVLLAPLMRVETMDADLSGGWGAVVITSANAPAAIASHPLRGALVGLPLFAVGQRSAQAAREAGFADVTSAGGDVRDLVRLVLARRADASAPVLYLAGEDRASDLSGELTARGMAIEMKVVYRAVSAPFPQALIDALNAGTVDAVLHFSRRSAQNYVTGATTAGMLAAALSPRHLCLSAQVAEPIAGAGATAVVIAARPDEAALIDLTGPPA